MAIVIKTFHLKQDFILISNLAYILEFGLRILDLRYSVGFIKRIERSDTINPKSKIYNPKLIVNIRTF